MKMLPFYALLLLGPPLAGVAAAGLPLERYIEFPPRSRYVEHSGFSRPVFMASAILILAVILPFLIRVSRGWRKTVPVKTETKPFPWWGWLGLGLNAGAWVLAWTRFEWFRPWQAHTFTPLWITFILVVNALTFRRAGRCLMTRRAGYFLALFPLSAAFWWFFEYLNRFVQNWHYTGTETFTPFEYFIYATLPFATVLPAVLSVREWLATFPRLTAGLDNFISLPPARPKRLAGVALALSCAGLAGTGVWPDFLFPLLWLAPLFIIASEQTLRGRGTVLSPLRTGDWREVCRLALAALLCGFFWEMWNSGSLAHWEYAVPYVNRFHLFEMPLLGYAGYLPFGIECALAAEVFLGPYRENPKSPQPETLRKRQPGASENR